MYKIKNIVDKNVLLMIYKTLILPYLSYCSEIWGNTYESRLHDLIVLQKRAIRIIGNVGYRDHTSKLFKSFKCLKLVDIIRLQTCVLMYNANKGILPRNVQLNFIKHRDVHKYNTRRRNDFFTSQSSTNLRKISVNQKGIELWNALPNRIKESVSINVFKTNIKNVILNSY